MHNRSERWQERKRESEGKNKRKHLDFLLHNILGNPLGVYKNLKTMAQIGAEKSVTKIVGERFDKGTDMQSMADSLIHSTKFVQNFKILSQVIPEKSLKESFPMYYTGVGDGKRKNVK